MEASSYGLKLIWLVADRFSLDAGVERYEQQGRDSITPEAAYPSANILVFGGRLWL